MTVGLRPLLFALLVGAGATFLAFEFTHAKGPETTTNHRGETVHITETSCSVDPAESVVPFRPVTEPPPPTRPFVPTSPYINPTGPITPSVPEPADAVHETSVEERYYGNPGPGTQGPRPLPGGPVCGYFKVC